MNLLRAPAVLAALLLPLLLPMAVQADGSLPPLPYRYLHPPPALASGNKLPVSAIRLLERDYLNAVGWGTFTPDTQAGITGHSGAFFLHPSTRAVAVSIKAVERPAGLTNQVAPDGNAYLFSAVEQPGDGPARLRKPVSIVLRWPHIPIALYLYHAGSWHQLCYSDTAVLTPSTIACPTRTLGIVQAVTTPSSTTSTTPATPASGLNPYIPILGALVLIAAAIVLGFVVTRPKRKDRV